MDDENLTTAELYLEVVRVICKWSAIGTIATIVVTILLRII